MSNTNKFSDLKTRMISAAILALGAFFCIWYGSFLMLFMMLAFCYLGLKEWTDLPIRSNFSFEAKRKWLGFGFLYVVWAAVSLLLIRFSNDLGFEAAIWLITIVVGTDVGAYFAGRFIGGPKVAPSISPNKTWSGVVGGVFAAMLLSGVALSLMDVPSQTITVLLAIVFSVISQVGDFFESHLKRRFGVKDTGSLLPGHGGLLDRFDGQIFVLTSAGIFAFIFGPMNNMAATLLVW